MVATRCGQADAIWGEGACASTGSIVYLTFYKTPCHPPKIILIECFSGPEETYSNTNFKRIF